MDIETALKGMMDAKRRLESRDSINIPTVLSENMDRLATYTSAVEEHLADLEEALEVLESKKWIDAVKDGKSPSAADTISKRETSKQRGEVKRLTRLVASSWKLVGVKQSRWNHLNAEMKQQV